MTHSRDCELAARYASTWPSTPAPGTPQPDARLQNTSHRSWPRYVLVTNFKMGRVALDGTKLEASASKYKAVSYGCLADREERIEAEIAQLEAKAAALLAGGQQAPFAAGCIFAAQEELASLAAGVGGSAGLREPAHEQLGPVRLAHGWPTREDPMRRRVLSPEHGLSGLGLTKTPDGRRRATRGASRRPSPSALTSTEPVNDQIAEVTHRARPRRAN